MLQKINKWNQRLRKKWFQGLLAKAWGHLCHSGTEVETAERSPKPNVSNSITFALSELVLTAPPGSTPHCPCGWLCVSLAHPFLTLKAFTAQKGSERYKNVAMPASAPCQFNSNQFDKSDTLLGQQPTPRQPRFLLLGSCPGSFSCS